MSQLRNRYFLASDLLLLPLAAFASYVLRLETFQLSPYWPGFLLFSALVACLIPLCFQRVGLYSRFWRYASVEELLLLAGAVTLATLLVGSALFLTPRLFAIPLYFPRSIPFIFLLLALSVTATPRLALRLLWRRGRRRGRGQAEMRPVVVIGAGDAGAMIVRELQDNPQLGMEVIGFLDDDPAKRDMRIHGVRVLGDRTLIGRVAEIHNVRQAIIAMPTAPGRVVRELVQLCEAAEVQPRIIPGVFELLGGTVSVNQLREVKIEDLLRRAPVQTDTQAIQALASGKVVLVTGGGGSIGSELCRQIAGFRPAQLVVLGHGENSLFHVCGELRRRFPALKVVSVIADVRDRDRLRAIYGQYRPTLIFHAAAHKHVPLMEDNPCEAITNNVVGTRNLVELAAEFGVAHFVMISTDKAVNPTSVMGASKRCAERIVHRVAQQTGRPYVVVRFGNVLGSNGSVVPFFQRQIAAGGPVTVTHPEMRRFFMTIPEAVQLVLQAATLGRGGEVFVLDMGKPVRILDLAEDLIRLSGLRPGEDIEIVITQPRPGDKLFEELFIATETYTRTRHEKIFVAESASQTREDGALLAAIEQLVTAAQHNDDGAIRPLLRQAVPEFQPMPGPSHATSGNGAAEVLSANGADAPADPIPRLRRGMMGGPSYASPG